MKMLTARAEKAQQSDSSHDWPELTEYSCTNCHHALEQPSWRQAKGTNASYLWDSWCTSLLGQAIGEKSSAALRNQLEELTKEMQRIAPSAYRTLRSTYHSQQCRNVRLGTFYFVAAAITGSIRAGTGVQHVRDRGACGVMVQVRGTKPISW